MVFPKPPAIADTSAWLTKDPAWVDARKAAWRLVHDTRLAGTGRRSAGEVKALERYFLTGKNPVPLTWGAHEYPSIPLLFRLWFHPDRTDANWEMQLATTVWGDYEISEHMLWHVCGGNGPGADGLEERLYYAFVGGQPTRRFLVLDEYLYGRIVYREKKIEGYRRDPGVGIDTVALILYMAEKFPRALGRYQLREWLTLPEHPFWQAYFERPEAVEKLHRLFHLVRFRSSPEAAAESTPAQVEVAQEFLALFDSGLGPQALQDAWRAHGANEAWKTKARTRLF